jgi:quercetin dioxygenase-like cupin family protein
MPERNPSDEIDEAVDAIMNDPEAPTPRVTPRLAALLQVAADLRELPRTDLKARLRTALRAGGRPLATGPEIAARLAEMAKEPRLVAHDLGAALRDLPEMRMRFLTSLDGCTIGVSRFSGASHWERHPAGDELLHLLDGEADVMTLTDDGPVRSLLRAGSIFVCPRGLWHQIVPRSPLSLLFATPGGATEHSAAPTHTPSGTAPTLAAHDVRAALHDLPELAITRATTDAEADAAVRTLTTLGPATVGVMRYSGLTPWERHPDGDELLHVLDGEVDVTVLADEGTRHVIVPAGSIFVCPRGLWHRQLPRPSVTMLYGTPSRTTEVSWADDPRTGGEG